jgi:glycosyltransferase involved in cell wall biosynthesis
MSLVTVIIPTWNRAEFLPRAIGSVLGQSYQDFELLVVDDGGDARSAEIVRSFGDRRLVYLRHSRRRGGAAARNTGVARARGEYVAFLDDDDEWLPEKLARQVALMRRSAPLVGASYTGCLVVEARSGEVRGQITPRRKGRLYPAILSDNLIGGTSSVIAKRSCLVHVGGFDERLPSFQDYDLWIRVAREFQFECISDPLLRYSVHERQVWSDLEALTRGLEMMLWKYGEHPGFRIKSSAYFQSFGMRYCERKDGAGARKAFWRATQLQPYELKNYVYLGASLLGPQGPEKLTRLKAELLEHAKKSALPPKVRRHA